MKKSYPHTRDVFKAFVGGRVASSLKHAFYQRIREVVNISTGHYTYYSYITI